MLFVDSLNLFCRCGILDSAQKSQENFQKTKYSTRKPKNLQVICQYVEGMLSNFQTNKIRSLMQGYVHVLS